jgi:hypothetical protein
MKKSIFKKIALVLTAVVLVSFYWGCKDEVTNTRLEMLEQKMQQDKYNDEIEKLRSEIKELKKAQQNEADSTVQNQ